MADNEKDQVFASPILKGGRFDRNAMPVDTLSILVTYKKLILAVAKELVKKRRRQQRAPRGFEQSFELFVREIRQGSATPILVRAIPEDHGVLFPWDEYGQDLEQAREVVSDAIQAVNRGESLPEGFSPSLVPDLEELGEPFEGDEHMEMVTPIRRAWPTYTVATREKLKRMPLQKTLAEQILTGEVFALNVAERTFELKPHGQPSVRGAFDFILEIGS